jgi:hypothetical protein
LYIYLSRVLIIVFKLPIPIPAVFGFVFELIGLMLFIPRPVLESFVFIYPMHIAIKLPVCVCLVAVQINPLWLISIIFTQVVLSLAYLPFSPGP